MHLELMLQIRYTMLKMKVTVAMLIENPEDFGTHF